MADWGGLQEWVTTLASGLAANNSRVGLVSSSAAVRSRSISSGVQVFELQQVENVPELVQRVCGDWDAVITTPVKARQVGVEFGRLIGAPVIATFHGVYSDYVYAWKHKASRIVAVAPALSDMLSVVGGIDHADIDVIPNGLPESELDLPSISYEQKVDNGVCQIAMASRLEADKLSMLGMLDLLIPKLQLLGFRNFNLTLMGDGSERSLFVSRLRGLSDRWQEFDFSLSGWLSTDAMCEVLRHATVTVGAGRTALHSLANGTPVVGVGSRAFVGISSVNRLQPMLDCNFGDYLPASDLSSFEDLSILSNAHQYNSSIQHAESVLRSGYTDKQVCDRFSALVRDAKANYNERQLGA